MRLVAFILTIFAVTAIGLSARASAFNPFEVCTADNNSPTCQQSRAQQARGTNPVVVTINKAVNAISVVAGVAAVIVIIIGGIMFITAGGATPGQRSGDPNKIKTARAAITGAAIGLVIIALSWTIISFVLHVIG